MLYWVTACFHKLTAQLGQGVSSRHSAGTGRMLMALLAVAMMAGVLFSSHAARAEQEFLDPKVAFVFSAAMVSPTEVDVHYKVAPQYYMYRERFEFTLTPDSDSRLLGVPVYPQGTVKYDPTFERDLEVYHNQVTVRVPVTAGANGPLTLAVTGQGCADAGLCYPPMTTRLTLTPTPTGYTASGVGVVPRVPAPVDETSAQSSAAGANAKASSANNLGGVLSLNDMGFASVLTQAGWLEIIGLCLVLGVLLTFTPCVLPMVPIVLAVVAGDARTAKKSSRWRGFGLAASYVLGMSLVYTVLGVVAGLIGASLAIWLQTPWVLALFAVILALLALAMFDVFTFQAPVGLQTALNGWSSKIPGGRWGGAFLMGMLSALIVGPCVAAPLAGVLLFISQTGDLVLGGSALFAMAWGQGILLLVVGATSGALLPRAGAWMDGVKRLFGILLLATAWWMVNSVLASWIVILGWAFLALYSAALLGAFDSLSPKANAVSISAGQYLLKTIGLMLALWGAILIVGLVGGGRELLRPLAPFSTASVVSTSDAVVNVATGLVTALPQVSKVAGVANDGVSRSGASTLPFVRVASVAQLDDLLANSDRPVMLDFYADWCVSCIEMEKFTFSDPQVAGKMSQFLLLQADVTKNTQDDRALLKRFNLFGPPGIIFFDRKGQPLTQARVVGFKDARAFESVLEHVLQQ